MTKKWLLLLIVVFAIPFYGHSQIFKSFNFQLYGGAELPLQAGHFQKYWHPGAHIGGALEVSLNEMIALKLDAGFNYFIFNHQKWKSDLLAISPNEATEDDFVVNGAGRYIIEASVLAKIFPFKAGKTVSPFILGGVGLINMQTDDLIIDLSGLEFTAESVPCFTAGFGAEISYWDNFRFFGQFVYKLAQTKDENAFNVPIDLKEAYKEQETHFAGLEFGIIFDLSK